MSAFNKNLQTNDDNRMDRVSRQWEAPSKNGVPYTNGTHNQDDEASTSQQTSDASLLKALYERIIVLEQHTREKDFKLDRLTQHITRNPIDPRFSGGVLVWQIHQFSSKVAAMAIDPNHMIYSPESYTSPHGYRFCVRLNISAKFPQFIGLHVHLMQSENDYHLEWPFRDALRLA